MGRGEAWGTVPVPRRVLRHEWKSRAWYGGVLVPESIISSAECSPTHTVLDGGMRNVSADYADAKCMIDGRMAAESIRRS